MFRLSPKTQILEKELLEALEEFLDSGKKIPDDKKEKIKDWVKIRLNKK